MKKMIVDGISFVLVLAMIIYAGFIFIGAIDYHYNWRPTSQRIESQLIEEAFGSDEEYDRLNEEASYGAR